MLSTFKTATGVFPHEVEAVVVTAGTDVTVCFGGGDTPHLGAVALGIPRPSLADPAQDSASASVLCVTAHKEDMLAREAALELATKLRTRVAVTVGIHVDDATGDDLGVLYENFKIVLADVRAALEKELGDDG